MHPPLLGPVAQPGTPNWPQPSYLKVQAEAGRARFQAPGRGFSRAGACVGRKQGRDPLRGRCCDRPLMHPSQGESPCFEKGLSPQLRLPPYSQPGKQAWRKGGEPRAEPQGALCLSISGGPPEDLESALGSQRPNSPPQNPQVSTQWGATSGPQAFPAGGSLLVLPLSPGTPAQA